MRDVESQGQYYTMSGRWAHRSTNQPKFYVPGFVKEHEFQEILPYLPQTAVTKNMEDKLQQLQKSLPRDIGKNLLRKMNDFWKRADETYLAAASRLENAHKYIASHNRIKYATLEELANVLLDEAPGISKEYNSSHSMSDLFAVHRAIMRSDIGFRVQPKGTLRAGGSYEVLSFSEVNEAAKVAEYVRSYSEKTAKGMLVPFIRKCQRLIDQSREHREFTPHGTIGPSRKSEVELRNTAQYRKGRPEDTFGNQDEIFLGFLESWACLQNFSSASNLNGIASAILRATKRYDDVNLDSRTGWTFLQEVGAIAPWESLGSYTLRLPDTGRRLSKEIPRPTKEYAKDKLADIRKDWGELPVFCIDQAGALEIDDGVSIEETGNPGEYWAHIHIADPSSHLNPDFGMVKHAERMVQNVYHPDRVVFMLDQEFVDSKLSLASGRPCLTFSARINMDGQILDHKVTAGVIRNVSYLSPSVFEAVASHELESHESDIRAVHVVGTGSTIEPTPLRKMSSKDELSNEQKQQLRLLHQVGRAHAKMLQSRGGMNQGPTNFEISVHFDGAEWEKPQLTHCIRYDGDPTIKVVIPNTDARTTSALGYLMLLANEVCAKWCSARGIPIPYRVTPNNPNKLDPTEYFKKVLAPSRNEEGVAPMETVSGYLEAVGAAQLSLTPGPHLAVGAEMIAKCTSPLRRFPDLLVHAQIGATLLEEARRGESLEGNTNEDFLPYSSKSISALLPQIDTRERSMKKAERDAKQTWLAHFLLRAWRFKEAELPSLSFTVKSSDEYKGNMSGTLNEFLADATCQVPDWLKADDVKPGDTFEVKIADIDTYIGRIDLEALRPKSPASVSV